MLEAHHFSAAAKAKGRYALPAEFDGRVSREALYHAVRAYRSNQRQGTHATKTRSEVSGGSRKPWRQKGTGRARQGTIRAPHWTGGGVAFGPKPRSYRLALPRRVRRQARQSALNARAAEGAVYVIEALEFERPQARRMAELIAAMELTDRKVLVLTAESRPEVYLSGRNLPEVHVTRYADASAYEILWSEAVVIEEGAIGGHAIKRGAGRATGRAKRAERAATGTKKAAGRALAKQRASSKKATKAGKRATKRTTKQGGGDDA